MQVIIDFIHHLKKPMFTNDEVDLLCDVSVSAAVDRAHMGLLTALADLVSVILYPPKPGENYRQETKLAQSAEKKQNMGAASSLSLQPIKMEIPLDEIQIKEEGEEEEK